jgi:hypothetical protein
MGESVGVGILDAVGALAALAMIAIAVFVVRRAGMAGREATRRDVLGYSGVGVLSALTSGIAYTAAAGSNSDATLAVANGAMVFTPAMVWAAARRINGRPITDIVPAAGLALVVAALTFVTPGQSAAVKVIFTAVFCAVACVETRRAPLRHMPGADIVAATTLAYGVYSAARLAGAVTLGLASPTWVALFSRTAATLVSMAALAALAIAVFRMAQALDDVPVAVTKARRRAALRGEGLRMLRESGPVAAVSLCSTDDELIRAAYGPDRADAVIAAIAEAARRALPGSARGRLSARGVVVLVPARSIPPAAEDRIRRSFAALSPRIAHGDLPDLHVATRSIHGASELSRFLAERPGPTATTTNPPALPFG